MTESFAKDGRKKFLTKHGAQTSFITVKKKKKARLSEISDLLKVIYDKW